MGARRVRRRGRGADDVDRRLARAPSPAAEPSIREVDRGEDELASALAELHGEAHAAGMALGMLAAPTADLERAYAWTVARLDAQNHVLVIAEQRDEILGMAQLVRGEATNAKHRAEVRRVAVAARARGRGIGRRLMAAIDDAARARAITLLWLTTHADTRACTFYEAVGYTLLGVMPSYSARPDGSVAPAAFFYRELA